MVRGVVGLITERTGLILWLNHLKAVKVLEKYGTIHYVSKKMKYAVLYINKDRLEQTTKQLQGLNFIQKVERSFRNEIRTEYNSKDMDETSLYTV